MTKRIQVQFFAAYRDAIGASRVDLDCDAQTAEDLFSTLRERYPQLERFPAAKVAINDELASWSTPLRDGDAVLLFPPVAGG